MASAGRAGEAADAVPPRYGVSLNSLLKMSLSCFRLLSLLPTHGQQQASIPTMRNESAQL